jgi:hypothetical protein
MEYRLPAHMNVSLPTFTSRWTDCQTLLSPGWLHILIAIELIVAAVMLLLIPILLLAGQSLPGISLRARLLRRVPYLGTFSGELWDLVLPLALVLFSTAAIYDFSLSRASRQSAVGAM